MQIYVAKEGEQLVESDWEKVEIPVPISILQETIDLEPIVKDRIVLERDGIRVFTELSSTSHERKYCLFLRRNN